MSNQSPQESSENTSGKPFSSQTAEEERGNIPWMEIAKDPEFRKLLHTKARFLVPATLFFVVYYFALPVLVGWFPEVMDREIVGSINLAYLFALSQFIMAWGIAALYVVVASGWDKRVAEILRRFGR